MENYALLDINTFASPPTEEEVKNWLFGHDHTAHTRVNSIHKDGGVRKEMCRRRGGKVHGNDVTGETMRPWRHSSYHAVPLEKEKQERAKLKKVHKRASSHGPHFSPAQGQGHKKLQAGLHMGNNSVEQDAVAAKHKSHSRHLSMLSPGSGQGHRFSFHVQVLKGERSVGTGNTLVGSKGSIESPSLSPTCVRFSAGSFLKFRPNPSQKRPPTCKHLPAASFSTIPPNPTSHSPYPTTLTAPASLLSRPHTRFNCRHSCPTPSSRSPASARTTMDEKSRMQKALDVFRQSSSKGKEEECLPQEKATDHDNVSHRLRPQRSLAQIGRKFHLGLGGAQRNTTQTPHSPPCQPSYSPRRHASLHSSGYSSLRNSDAFSHGNHHDYSSVPPSQASYGNINTGHQPIGEQGIADDDEEEPDPALLGSFDYHKFLSVTSNRKMPTMGPIPTMQPALSTPRHDSNINMDDCEHSRHETAIKSRSISHQGTLVPTPTRQQALHQKLKTKQSLPLLERRTQRLQEQFGNTDLVFALTPHQPSLEALQFQDSPSIQEPRVQRLPSLYAWEDTSKATRDNSDSSQLQGSSTTPGTATATSSTSASLPVFIVDSPLPSRSVSLARLPRTPRQAQAPSVLANSPPSYDSSYPPKAMPLTSRSPVDPPTAVAHLGRAPLEMSTSGPSEIISYKEIDPEKLKPFIGPLTKPTPPPTKPLPQTPIARMRRFDVSNSSKAMAEESNISILPSFSRVPTEAMASDKQSVQSIKSNTLTADRTESSIETKTGQKSHWDKRTLLRKKVSALFGEEHSSTPAPRATEADHDITSISTYRPISMNSLDADDNSFLDIFDDVFNAARDSISESQRSAGPSLNSGRSSFSVASKDIAVAKRAPRASIPTWPIIKPASRVEVAERLAARLGITDSASRVAIHEALAEVSPTAPPLTDHPAIRGDLPLQARLGMIVDSTYASVQAGSRGRQDQEDNISALISTHAVRPDGTAGLHVLPLNVGRQRPTQVAVSTRHASRSTVETVEPFTGFTTRSLVAVPAPNKGQDDVDPSPAFDRSVDLTWYRYAKDAGRGIRESSLPFLPANFDALSTVFMVKFSRGRDSKSAAYDQLRRFAYFELDGPIRFKIMEKLLEDCLPGKPVLLNHSRQAAPAWPEDAFATLWQVLGPLQKIVRACPRLRADVMTALFMMQPFHVIFSPFVKSITQPLPTKWLFKYLYFMQDVRVELDMTKLGFGQVWQATGLSTRLWDIGNLVDVFVDEMLKRDASTNPMGQLTIHCRRYFGYRQGENPHRGDVNFYIAPAGQDEDQKSGAQPEGQPWNYGRVSASLPPSANNPYSGHRRHHTGGPERVPFLHEGHMSVANPFYKLTGRVCSVRMVGMSEKWSMDFLNFWPKSEFDIVPKERLGLHIDRYTPSRHSYAAPGHAVFLDYGVRAGVHRFPPLPDSEPMVCTVYDKYNDLFLEVGSGNILTVKDRGVEIIARSRNPPMPRSDLPIRGGSPVSLGGIIGAPSRIPGPVGTVVSPTMQAMRNGTPQKALQLLGPEAGGASLVGPSASLTLQVDDNEDGEDLLTPTASRVSSAVTYPSHRRISKEADPDDDRLSEVAFDRRHSSSATASRARSTKKTYRGLMGSDHQDPSN